MKKLLTVVLTLGCLTSLFWIGAAVAGINNPPGEQVTERRPTVAEIEQLRQHFRDDPHVFACVNDDGSVVGAHVDAATPDQVAAAKEISAAAHGQLTTPKSQWTTEQLSQQQVAQSPEEIPVPPGLPCEEPL